MRWGKGKAHTCVRKTGLACRQLARTELPESDQKPNVQEKVLQTSLGKANSIFSIHHKSQEFPLWPRVRDSVMQQMLQRSIMSDAQ